MDADGRDLRARVPPLGVDSHGAVYLPEDDLHRDWRTVFECQFDRTTRQARDPDFQSRLYQTEGFHCQSYIPIPEV